MGGAEGPSQPQGVLVRLINVTTASPETITPSAVSAQVRDDERDLDALTTLFRSQYAPLVRLAFLLVGSNTVAEELVQDAFAQLVRRWNTVEHPKAYLRAAVLNICRSHVRRAILERRHRSVPALSATDSPDELSDALARLSPRKRTAIVLRFYEDLTEEQIASALGCRPGTVKSLIHRGLADLRGMVES